MASQQSGSSRSNNTEIGGFLKNCIRCNRNIDPKSDIFMGGDYRAFCSPECRDNQIAADEAAAKRQGKAKGKGKEKGTSSNSKQ